jgi:hypothetical protein
LVLAASAAAGFAKIEEWRDVQGKTFRGEPEEALGPIALFRSDKMGAAIMVPFHLLSPEDCLRFYEQSKHKPARAEKWKDAKSQVSIDMLRYTLTVSGSNLVPPNLDDRREPQFYAVLYSSPQEPRAWDVIDAVLPIYPKLMQAFPGEVEVLFHGVGQDPGDHRRIATSKAMPWLVSKLNEQKRWEAVRLATPREKPGVVVFHRDGAVLYYVDGTEMHELARPIKQLAVLLDTIRPDNPKGWKDRAHYLKSIQPVIHAKGRSDPVLVGNPLQADGLRQRKIYRVEATLSVDAEGKVSAVDLKPDDANLPAAMSAPIATALKRSSVFVAAVENGKFVDGTYHYLLEIPRELE